MSLPSIPGNGISSSSFRHKEEFYRQLDALDEDEDDDEGWEEEKKRRARCRLFTRAAMGGGETTMTAATVVPETIPSTIPAKITATITATIKATATGTTTARAMGRVMPMGTGAKEVEEDSGEGGVTEMIEETIIAEAPAATKSKPPLLPPKVLRESSRSKLASGKNLDDKSTADMTSTAAAAAAIIPSTAATPAARVMKPKRKQSRDDSGNGMTRIPATAVPDVIDLTSDIEPESEDVGDESVIPATLSTITRKRRAPSTTEEPARLKIIKATPIPLKPRPDSLRTTFETPIPETVIAKVIRKNPAAATAVASPSVTAARNNAANKNTKTHKRTNSKNDNVNASAMSKKRKRTNKPKLVPEPERIFAGLKFYYIPDNDVHPARKLRIAKAREYGGEWVRSVDEASHVVVDRGIGWKDVGGALGGRAVEGTGTDGLVVVNEDYPIDCVRFRTILNPEQRQYRIRGFPEKEKTVAPTTTAMGQNEPTSGQAVVDVEDDGPPSAQMSEREVKSPRRSQREVSPATRSVPTLERHVTAPVRAGTDLPSGMGQRTLSSPLQSPRSSPAPPSTISPSRPRTNTANTTTASDPAWINAKVGGGGGDELEGYMNMIQKYKHLPLDNDEDDDGDNRPARSGDTGLDDHEEEDGDSGESEGEREMKRRKMTLRSSQMPTTGAGSKKKGEKGGKGKAIGWEDRFACLKGGTVESYKNAKGATTPSDSNKTTTTTKNSDANPNARTIQILQELQTYYTLTSDPWRSLAYRKAISTLRAQTTLIRTAAEAYALPNVGTRLAEKIEEIVETDRLRKLDTVRGEDDGTGLKLFLGIYGVGGAVAGRWVARGYRTLEDVLGEGDDNKKGKGKGKPGVNLTPAQRIGIERYADINSRIPRREVDVLAAVVKTAAKGIDPEVELIVGGSYRRGAEKSGDVDFVVTKKGSRVEGELCLFLERLLVMLEERGVAVCSLVGGHGGKGPGGRDGGSRKWHGCCVIPEDVARGMVPGPEESSIPLKDHKTGESGKGKRKSKEKRYNPVWRRVDFLLVPEEEIGAALLYFTGNDVFNRSMRLLASKRGMRLNQRGLWRDVMRGPGREKVTVGSLVEGRCERKIFEVLGVKWREPWERWC